MTEKVHVEIDRNEAENNPSIIAEVNAHRDVESWGVDNLDAADLRIGNVGFERKTINDFASSILDNRMPEQRHKMTSMYDKAYILIEGDMIQFTDKMAVKSDINSASLIGVLARTTDSGIPVIPCSNLILLVDVAVRLARKHVEPSSMYLPTGTVKKPTAPPTMQMYGCLPNVGLETARSLYQRWPTMTQFIQEATLKTLQEIDGIGEVSATEIMKAIEGK